MKITSIRKINYDNPVLVYDVIEEVKIIYE